MAIELPAAERLPFTAEYYRLGSKPAALIPGLLLTLCLRALRRRDEDAPGG